jgi:hypothetical protein
MFLTISPRYIPLHIFSYLPSQSQRVSASKSQKQ